MDIVYLAGLGKRLLSHLSVMVIIHLVQQGLELIDIAVSRSPQPHILINYGYGQISG